METVFRSFLIPGLCGVFNLRLGHSIPFWLALSRNFIDRDFENGGLALIRQGKSPPKRSLDGAPWRVKRIGAFLPPAMTAVTR